MPVPTAVPDVHWCPTAFVAGYETTGRPSVVHSIQDKARRDNPGQCETGWTNNCPTSDERRATSTSSFGVSLLYS